MRLLLSPIVLMALLAGCAATAPSREVSPELAADIATCQERTREEREAWPAKLRILATDDLQRYYENCMRQHGWKLRSER